MQRKLPQGSGACGYELVGGRGLPEVDQGHPARLAETLTLTSPRDLRRAVNVLNVEHGGATGVRGHSSVGEDDDGGGGCLVDLLDGDSSGGTGGQCCNCRNVKMMEVV